MTDLPEPDIRASIEAWPITCATCGRAFLVIPDNPADPVIFDTVTGNSEPLAIQCACGAEIWLEPEAGGWRPWQLFAIGGRPRLSGPVIPARPSRLVRLLIRLLRWLTESRPSPGQK